MAFGLPTQLRFLKLPFDLSGVDCLGDLYTALTFCFELIIIWLVMLVSVINGTRNTDKSTAEIYYSTISGVLNVFTAPSTYIMYCTVPS